jgi:predicted dehydrogenase
MHHLLFLDPGHFHAALSLRMPHPRVADEIVVYAPDEPERRDFLALVERFNARAVSPTRWHVDVVTSSDPLDRLVADRRGDVVVLAGKNRGKAGVIRRLHDAGFHVLADKPWLVAPEDLEDIRASLTSRPVVSEIMTGRHDVAARVLRRLVAATDVVGALRADVAAIEMESVHYLEKLVDGAPLRRPWWFFDTRVQGRGVVDIPTHLVDRAQWLTEHIAPAAEAQLVSARTWPTRVPLETVRRITGEADVPDALRPCVDGNALAYDCNAALEFRVNSVLARAEARWDRRAPADGGDTSLLIVRATQATVCLEQSARTGHRRRLVMEPHEDRATRALDDFVRAVQPEFPGLRAEHRDGARTELVIPAALDGGHEAHFALVLDQFLRTIDDGRWPAEIAARTRAKYALLAEAVAASG